MFDSKNSSVSDYQFLIILYYYKLGNLPILSVNNIDELHFITKVVDYIIIKMHVRYTYYNHYAITYVI